MFDWLKKLVLEKWLGRAILVAAASASGYMVNELGLPADPVVHWIDASKELLNVALPLAVAWLLGMARQKVALDKFPGDK